MTNSEVRLIKKKPLSKDYRTPRVLESKILGSGRPKMPPNKSFYFTRSVIEGHQKVERMTHPGSLIPTRVRGKGRKRGNDED